MEVLDGAQLGDYNLIKQIGQGSLGTVYLAEHRFIRQQRVVKILPEELGDDRAFIQRFEEEVGLLATLNHPHIVKVHDISYAEGKYFLVTDCIVDAMGETTNLAQYLQQQEAPLEEEALRSLLRPLAEALDYAHHEKGVVHRGLKLNNILVGQSEEGIGLFLSDYGLTRIIGQAAVLSRTYKAVAESVGINQLFAPSIGGSEKYVSGAIDGSQIALLHNSFLQNFAFLAPEQKEPDAAVDYKADIYAFGVLAYYLLTRQYPEGIFDIPKWERLIRGCLARNPEQRVERLAPLFNPSMKIPTPSTHPQPIYHDPKIERPSLDFDPTTLLHVDNTVKTFCPEKKNVDDLKPMDTEMVIVPGGTYYRGSHEGNRDEMPRHLVHLRPFAIEMHPVTNEQFVRFLEVMGGEKDSSHHDIILLKDSRIKRTRGKLVIESGYHKHPVVGVTWYGAVAYAKWTGKRLPTEAEWEIAACGGDPKARFPSGENIEKNQANFFSSDTTPVMSYPPNATGLYDMAGNVYEWCQDWYGYNYYTNSVQEPDNPKGPIQGVYRVLRGGCWKSLKDDLAISRRHRNNPGTVNSTYGFRCATDAQ